MMKLINKILSLKEMKAVTNGEYENIQKYRIARGELKQTIDDYNKILSLFVKNATMKQLKDILKEKNVKKIKFLCIIAAPEGLKKVQEKHPDVQIYCAKIDDHLNENAYIVPGLGDAGDRIYGTK